jgi:predicted NAD-dependent protein-ADP-ribosyltransferase YbiA (DUF1768 family)
VDIKSKASYPANKLSNFAPNPFVIEGVKCASMEGFLQSLKFKNPDMQKEVCKLVGFAAKKKGSKKNWHRDGILYWKGEEINRFSPGYQHLLTIAFEALSKNIKFKRALLATGHAQLTHSIGRRSMKDTILTKVEFTSRLMRMREKIRSKMVSETFGWNETLQKIYP